MTITRMKCSAYVGKSTLHGVRYGVFADRLILTGDLVEECVVMRVPYDIEGKNVLNEYRIRWDDESDIVATGCAQMYNHSEEPNVAFDEDFKSGILRIVAIKAVGPGQEMFVRYRCGKWW